MSQQKPKSEVEHSTDEQDTKEAIKQTTGRAANAVKAAGQWLKAHLLLMFIIILVVFGLLELVGVETGIPDAVVSHVVYATLGVIIAFPFAWIILKWLVKRVKVLLHDVDPKSGDAAGWELPPEVWRDLTVYRRDYIDGKEIVREVDKDELHKINVKNGTGYEVLEYDPETNSAYVTWMAGKSSTDIRRDKKQIGYITQELATVADLALDVVSNVRQIARSAASREINKNIRVTEGVQMQDSEAVSSSIAAAIENSELANHPEINLNTGTDRSELDMPTPESKEGDDDE